MVNEIYPLGTLPTIGEVPKKMHAAVLRQENYGHPANAFTIEKVDIPNIGKNDVLIAVMAAGVNYDGVWAALGNPVDVIKQNARRGYKEDYHIAGSDASGVVWAIGDEVNNVVIGDEVVISCGIWDKNANDIQDGKSPMESETAGIWGYDTNYGSFAQFALVKDFQCYEKPRHLTWEQASCFMLTGATAFRQLMGFPPHQLHKEDPVLIWGGAGGLGEMAIKISRAFDAVPIAVVSDQEKEEFCKSIGAKGTINRKNFTHWGRLPNIENGIEMKNWTLEAKRFLNAYYDALGEKRKPRIIFEHSGQDTIPTSIFICDTGGMVVICGGTSGYNADVDLRYLWVKQKRLQGSHFANPDDCAGINKLVKTKKVPPTISEILDFEQIGLSHQKLLDNKNKSGSMVIKVGIK